MKKKFCRFQENNRIFCLSDDYMLESNMYFSPYGDIGLTNQPRKDNGESSKRAPVEENRDILDLSRKDEMADELSNIIKELDEAGNSANSRGVDTLDDMIKRGKIKGLPKGTKPEVGLEHQGIPLPIQNMEAQCARNNYRVNPLQRPARRNGERSGLSLRSQLQSVLQAGKMKNANNFQRLPHAVSNGFHTPANRYHHQRLVQPPVPSMIQLDLLNSLNLDTSAYRNMMQKNQNGGLIEYMRTVSVNLGPKYDMRIQREIAEKQKKCVLVTEDGGFIPISSDGSGIEHECFVIGTNTTLNSRFSAL